MTKKQKNPYSFHHPLLHKNLDNLPHPHIAITAMEIRFKLSTFLVVKVLRTGTLDILYLRVLLYFTCTSV